MKVDHKLNNLSIKELQDAVRLSSFKVKEMEDHLPEIVRVNIGNVLTNYMQQFD